MTLFPRSLLLNTIQRSNSPVICDNSSRNVGVRLLSSRKMWMLKLLAFALVLAVFFTGITESGRNRYSPCSPRSCQVSSWPHWSQCTHQYGTSGTQTRKRKKTVVESCGGSCSFALSENRSCNTENGRELPQAKFVLVNRGIEGRVVRKIS